MGAGGEGGTRLKIDTCSPATGGLQRSRSDVKRMREQRNEPQEEIQSRQHKTNEQTTKKQANKCYKVFGKERGDEYFR